MYGLKGPGLSTNRKHICDNKNIIGDPPWPTTMTWWYIITKAGWDTREIYDMVDWEAKWEASKTIRG
jgi:hypothetical protein